MYYQIGSINLLHTNIKLLTIINLLTNYTTYNGILTSKNKVLLIGSFQHNTPCINCITLNIGLIRSSNLCTFLRRTFL